MLSASRRVAGTFQIYDRTPFGDLASGNSYRLTASRVYVHCCCLSLLRDSWADLYAATCWPRIECVHDLQRPSSVDIPETSIREKSLDRQVSAQNVYPQVRLMSAHSCYKHHSYRRISGFWWRPNGNRGWAALFGQQNRTQQRGSKLSGYDISENSGLVACAEAVFMYKPLVFTLKLFSNSW